MAKNKLKIKLNHKQRRFDSEKKLNERPKENGVIFVPNKRSQNQDDKGPDNKGPVVFSILQISNLLLSGTKQASAKSESFSISM